jgi:hypothetical protein
MGGGEGGEKKYCDGTKFENIKKKETASLSKTV